MYGDVGAKGRCEFVHRNGLCVAFGISGTVDMNAALQVVRGIEPSPLTSTDPRGLAMQESRIRWSSKVRNDKIGLRDGGLWKPATPQNLEDFEVIVAAGNEAYGAGSHWIERRNA